MDMTRRNFLVGTMATTATISVRQMFAATPGTVTGTPRLKVGVLSDIHLHRHHPDRQKVFIKALEWYRAQDVDAVLIAGDMADGGHVSELQQVADAWFKVFPDGKAPDGRTVTQLFCLGNHDAWERAQLSGTPEEQEKQKSWISRNIERAWESAFREKYEPIFMKTVKGYQFVGVHWPDMNQRTAWFEAHAKEIDMTKPFFYFQHPHPKDTCYGAWAWGHDDGTATRLLMPFPNAIALSGHSHYPLTDERSVWQGTFTSIGTSSLHYSGIEYGYRENGYHAGNSYGMRENRAHQMSPMDSSAGKQGMLFTLCDDHIRIERHEFVYDQSLGDDWILPIGTDAAKPFEYAKRKPSRTAPEFAKDAVATVELDEPKPVKDKDGKPIVGKDGKSVMKPEKLKVTFPAAEPRNKCRVFDYEIQAVALADDVEIAVATRRVMATDFHLPLSQAGKAGFCLFALADLPKKTPIRFDIRPLECFGKRGAPISSPVFTTPAE